MTATLTEQRKNLAADLAAKREAAAREYAEIINREIADAGDAKRLNELASELHLSHHEVDADLAAAADARAANGIITEQQAALPQCHKNAEKAAKAQKAAHEARLKAERDEKTANFEAANCGRLVSEANILIQESRRHLQSLRENFPRVFTSNPEQQP